MTSRFVEGQLQMDLTPNPTQDTDQVGDELLRVATETTHGEHSDAALPGVTVVPVEAAPEAEPKILLGDVEIERPSDDSREQYQPFQASTPRKSTRRARPPAQRSAGYRTAAQRNARAHEAEARRHRGGW